MIPSTPARNPKMSARIAKVLVVCDRTGERRPVVLQRYNRRSVPTVDLWALRWVVSTTVRQRELHQRSTREDRRSHDSEDHLDCCYIGRAIHCTEQQVDTKGHQQPMPHAIPLVRYMTSAMPTAPRTAATPMTNHPGAESLIKSTRRNAPKKLARKIPKPIQNIANPSTGRVGGTVVTRPGVAGGKRHRC